MLSYQRKQYDMLVTNCKARKKEERVTSSENGDNSSGKQICKSCTNFIIKDQMEYDDVYIVVYVIIHIF